jgi:hypothetical protein
MNKYDSRPLSRVVKGESSVQLHSNLDGVGSIPAIPNAQYVPSLLCHEQFNEASLPDIITHETPIPDCSFLESCGLPG